MVRIQYTGGSVELGFNQVRIWDASYPNGEAIFCLFLPSHVERIRHQDAVSDQQPIVIPEYGPR